MREVEQQQQQQFAGHQIRIASRSNAGVVILAIALACALSCAGCKSGGASNPFQAAPTRVPAPPTRSFQTNGNYYNSPGSVPAAPGSAVGTGVTGQANWSSTPNAVNSANSAGVYTSWLERTGTGYSVRTAPSGTTAPSAAPPATPSPNTRSSVPSDPPFPTTTRYESASSVQPAQYQVPQPPPPSSSSSSSSGSSSSGSSSSGSGDLIWRTPRP